MLMFGHQFLILGRFRFSLTSSYSIFFEAWASLMLCLPSQFEAGFLVERPFLKRSRAGPSSFGIRQGGLGSLSDRPVGNAAMPSCSSTALISAGSIRSITKI